MNKRPATNEQGDLWGIVLAGGSGQRLQAFLRQQGHAHPVKQYCNIVGRRTMLQHTWARLEMLIPQERVLTVVGAGHEATFSGHLAERHPESVLCQPANRETAPGVMLPLAHVTRADPRAVVGVFPSDHFVLEENRLMAYVWAASNAVRRGERNVVILGATASRADTDYGWIEVDQAADAASVLSVRRFWEKPTAEVATLLHNAGHLWSTMVIVARAAALWDLVCDAQPLLRRPFERIRKALATADETESVDREYSTMPEVSLSRDVLERCPSRLGTMVLNGVYWSDWGREERVRETLRYLAWLSCARRDPVGSARTSPQAENARLCGADTLQPRPAQSARRDQRRPS